MDRALFTAIHEESSGVGCIFLLNLADSLELGLLSRESYGAYLTWLRGRPDRSLDGWWTQPPTSPLPANVEPVLAASSRLVTVMAVPMAGLPTYSGRSRVYGTPPSPQAMVATEASLEALRSRMGSKLHYWITDSLALGAAGSADEVRDLLGLDWLGAEWAVFKVYLDAAHVSACETRRPSGLCDGSARFRARRPDEAAPTSHPGWGRAVHLGAWRAGRSRALLPATGAPELITMAGPLAATGAPVDYVGETATDSGCLDPTDHAQFALALNAGNAVAPDALLQRLL